MRFSGLASWLLTAALWAVAIAPSPVLAQGRAQEQDVDPEARQRFQLATTLYGQGRFVEAAEEFERVYEITDNPVLLHNIYVAYRDAGDEPRAAQFLRQYLEEAEEIPDRAVMEGRLRTLERQIAEAEARDGDDAVEPPPPYDATEPLEPVAGDPQPQAPPPEPRSTWPIVVSAVVAAVGAAAIGVGAVLGVQAADQYEELENDCGSALICPASKQDDVDSLGATALAADILLIGGAVLAVGGLTWLIVEVASGGDDGAEARAVTPALACDGSGCAAGLRGSF